MFDDWKHQARRLKSLVFALALAYRDPRTPWTARIVAACVVGYAFSPIDLIPDLVPILGYVDDLVLIPLGVALAVKLLPADVWRDAQSAAERAVQAGRPVNRIAAAVIVLLWLGVAVAAIVLARRIL